MLTQKQARRARRKYIIEIIGDAFAAASLFGMLWLGLLFAGAGQ